jgi:hypothetical protein
MKSYLLNKYLNAPNSVRSVNHILAQSGGAALKAATFVAVTDNSTGVAANGWKAVPLAKEFTHVNAASDLALSSDFYVVAGKVNNAIGVLKGSINQLLTALGWTPIISGGDGTVAVAGTVPALEKTVDGSAGATAVVVSRADGNAVLKNLRDNLSTLLLAYNLVQDSIGLKRQMDYGEGKASSGLVLANIPAAGTAVANTADCMSKVGADASFAILVDNVAKLAALVDTVLDNHP